MYAKKTVDKRIDIKASTTILGYLNLDRSIYFADNKDNRPDAKKRLIIKVIPSFSDGPHFQNGQEAILKKILTGSLYYFKPQSYDFKDNSLYLCLKLQPLSLQTLIWIYQNEEKNFSSEFIRQFTVRIFQGIARLKSTEIFPQNLKPTNIFYEVKSMQDKNWVWSQAGLHTNKRSQCYYKYNLQNMAKNNSMKIDPFQMEFYSLAIMLIEMITFQSPMEIDRIIRKEGDLNQIKNFRDAEEYYGSRLTHIIQLLMQPPKDNTLNKAVQQYKQSKEEEENQEPKYEDYEFTQQRIEKYFKQNLLGHMEQTSKKYIKQKNYSSRDIFEKMGEIDPEFSFCVGGMKQFAQLLRYLGVKLSKSQLLFVTTFYTSYSAVRYFKFIQLLYPPKQLIQCIIIKAVDQYDNNFKEFFEAQTGAKDFWKVQEIKQFLQTMEAPFEEKDVVDTLKQWTKGSKTSIKYNQIYNVFKPILGMSMSLSTLKKKDNTENNEDGHTCLIKILLKLKKKRQQVYNEDLVTYFRKQDIKSNWTVDSKIYTTIKNYVKDKELNDQQIFRKAFLEMENIGSIPGDMSKQINYVYLLRNLQLEEPILLLRQVLTQMVNQSSRQEFFEKYRRHDKGWTYESLKLFNEDEGLEFEERELRSLFKQMDNDNSGVVQTKQLFFKLTNIKQFDYQMIINNLKEVIQKQGIYLLEVFQDADPKARLVLGNPTQLQKILENLGIQLSPDHLNQLYNKFARNNRFEYLVFLREFYPKQKLFFSSIKTVLFEHYKGNFEKLFQMGVRENQKKWNKQSLSLVNQEMVLGFRQSELKQIWAILDSNGDGSLTKQQVADAFNCEIEKTTELTRKTLDSIQDLRLNKHQSKDNDHLSPKKHLPSDRKQTSQEVIMESFKQLDEKALLNLCTKLISQGQQNNGKILIQTCSSILIQNGIQIHKNQMIKFLSRFKQLQAKRPFINLIALYIYIYDTNYKQEESLPRLKANLMVTIIKEIKRQKELSNQNIFQWCRKKDRMRLNDFEDVIRKLTGVDVYFEDLETIWNFWGEPEYLTEEDFDNVLKTKQFKNKLEKQKSFKDQEKLPQKQNNYPIKKKGESNKMVDFVNESQGSDTPYLKKPMSFNEKEPLPLKRQQSSRSKNQQTPVNKFKAQQSRQINQKQGTSRFAQDKKKAPAYQKANKQQKIQLQQYVTPANSKLKDKQHRQDQKNAYNKNQLIEKLKMEINENGQVHINQLFSKANVVEIKRFIGCISIHYNFEEKEASQLAEVVSTFGKVKLDTLKNMIFKSEESPNGKQSKSKDRYQKSKHTDSPKKQRERQGEKQGKRIIDPRRQKANVPLIKQHIKSLISSFCKKFQIHELQGYFFGEKDTILRGEFISKCQSISTAFSSNTCEKLFDFFKPDGQDKVGVLSFKLGMGTQEPVNVQLQAYLPQQLEKQLKAIFEKADKDHSGFIQSNQIEALLSSLGFNENVKEIQNYFAKIDQNYDNRISYNEFKIYIEDQILPFLSNFDEDEEELQEMLRDNDIFRHGSLAPQTFQAVIERYGVKLSPLQIQVLIRSLNPEGTQIHIGQLLDYARQPSHSSGKIKSILYKIRLRKKVQLRQIQKVFENISSCFVLAYTPTVIQKRITNISTPYRPVMHESGLFYTDLPIRDARKIGISQESLISGQILSNDILVQLLLKEVNGVPIPQKTQVKSNIVRRYLDISFFDLSAQMIKYSIWQIEAQWDSQVEDVWTFNNNVRSLFVKVGGYDPRKFEKIVLLFELVIVVIEGNRTIQINCGCCNMPLRELQTAEGKTSKKLKLIAGLPNRSKQIDKNSISKRSGWKNFFGGGAQSELEIELVHQNKFKQHHRMIAALPAQVILGRKALHYLWTYRQSLAECCFDGNNVNPFLASDIKFITFLLTLDIPDVYSKVLLFWKQKIQSKVKSLSDSKKVFKVLMQDLYLIINSKQFQLLKKCPSKLTSHKKSLQAARLKMVGEVFDNVQNWLTTTGASSAYRRKKNYNYNYGPLQIHEVVLPREHQAFLQNLAKLTSK